MTEPIPISTVRYSENTVDRPPRSIEGPFRRMVRSLSRSGKRSPSGQLPEREKHRSPSRDRLGEGHALSTSPAPDFYYPLPPNSTLQSGEANGSARDAESQGARAADVGSDNHFGAPGVSFAPSVGRDVVKPDTELDTWNPPPRRSQSTRVKRGDSATSLGKSGISRNRAGSTNELQKTGDIQEESVQPGTLPSGERRGVHLEDKPLSRTGGGTMSGRSQSVRRAASTLRRAVEQSFAPPPREDGEIRVLILVADGSEEIEVFTPFDVFVRANMNPVLVSVTPRYSPSESLPYITLSRGARILATTKFETLKQEAKDDFDAVIIPGGAKGAERLAEDKSVQELIQAFYEQEKTVGMICAGSLAAKSAGIGKGEAGTSHPSVRKELEDWFVYSEDRVVKSGPLITSRGPGTALEFALAIVEELAGKAKRDEVAEPMMI